MHRLPALHGTFFTTVRFLATQACLFMTSQQFFWPLLVCCLVSIWADARSLAAQGRDEDIRDGGGSLLEQITTGGTAFPNGMPVVLKPPLLDDSLDAVARQGALDSLAGGIGWDRFSRNSYVSPIEMDLQYVKDNHGERTGHLVHVAFVAHLDFEQLRDPDQVRAMFQSDAGDVQAEEFFAAQATKGQLAGWGIRDRRDDTTYHQIRIPLLNRVVLEGWLQAQVIAGEDSILIAWLLDPRFTLTETTSTGNRWSPITQPDDAKSDDAATFPYQGLAGYIHVTRLDQPAGACLVEARIAVHEPTEWFRGSNLLRSKLPLMIQESVRKFRRRWGS